VEENGNGITMVYCVTATITAVKSYVADAFIVLGL